MPTYVDIQIDDAKFSELQEGDTVIFDDGIEEKIVGLTVWDDDKNGGDIQFRDYSIDVYEDLRNRDGYRRNSIEIVTRTITLEALKRLLDNQP